MKTLYTKICPICSKEFKYLRYKSVEKNNSTQTCSKECAYKLRSNKLVGRLIPNKYNQIDETTWTTTECKICGKSFRHHTKTKRTFCSILCKGKWQSANTKGENNPNWKSPEERTAQKDVTRSFRRWLTKKRVQCERCGTKEKLQVHHLDRNRENNAEENLLLLCKFCHAKAHEKDGNNISKLILSNHKNSV